MSDLSIVVAPGITLSGSYNIAELNKLGLPTIQLTGTVSSTNLATGAVTAIKVAADAFFYGVDAGATDAYAVAFNPAVTGLADGLILAFKAKTRNTGACTLNPNGLGAIPLKKCGGSRDLDDYDIRALSIVEVRYNVGDPVGPPIVSPYFEVLSLLGNAPKDYPMQGATALGRGLGGIVPEPAAGDQAKVLFGSGLWTDPSATIDARVTLAVGTTLELFKLQNFR